MALYRDQEHASRRADAIERQAQRELELRAEAEAVAGPEPAGGRQ